MKKWIFTSDKKETIWETSVEEYAEEFKQLLDKEKREYVVTVQET